MNYLNLVTGAAFVAAAAVLGAEARVPAAGLPIPRKALALLAAFALTTGASEWAEMAIDIEELAHGAALAGTLAIDLALVTASFALLLRFSIALQDSGRIRLSFLPGLCTFSLLMWAVALLAWLSRNASMPLSQTHESVEALTRWALGLPASFCGAAGLFALAQSLAADNWPMSRLVRRAGWVLLVHGAAAAMLILPHHLRPTWPFGPEGFGPDLAMTVEVARAACGAAIAVLLSEAFVFQTSQRLRREETYLRDDFVALVTHELGTPAAALELAAERLGAAHRAARPVDDRLAGDVRACAVTLRRIVLDLLDASRLNARQLEVTPEAIELRPFLERAASVSAAADALARPVELSCSPGLFVMADPARLDQILRNLLSNAAKYSRPGSTIAIEAAEGRRGTVALRVSNEGPPIAPGELSRIFSQRYRAPAAARVPGLGLGLYVARGLVEASGGRIWVERLGERTQFCFTLPRVAVAPEAAAAAAGEPQRAGRAS